ncbi:hypothetical protein RND71_038294 [Anisodus tanguticus]|uniref:Serine hydroxymethyltransferase-like domain-containing protein n=1 Tax=Anisodus tanguticus TaxID=243964 RepID=A0AAE1QZP3_9SOLA|nr:hypothetical protein RND71_038294 [Anisodus tanguticus]
MPRRRPPDLIFSISDDGDVEDEDSGEVNRITQELNLEKSAPVLEDLMDTFQMWDPGISFDFMDVTGSPDNVDAQTLFEEIRNLWSCLFAKLSDWEKLGGVELGVAAFDSVYLYICFRVTESIEDQHLDYSFMEYEHGLPVKELHYDDDMVLISKFIVSTKFMCKILEQTVGNQLRDALRHNKWTVLSSPAYFVCDIYTKTLESPSSNNNSYRSMNLQPCSYSSAGFIIYLGFSNRPFDPSIRDTRLPYGAKDLVRYIWIRNQWNVLLEHIDSASANFIKLAEDKPWKGLELILLVNLMQIVRSLSTITSSEGHLGTTYCGGNKYIDKGGHLSHGNQIDTNKAFGVSIFFETMPYKRDGSNGYIDYRQLVFHVLHSLWMLSLHYSCVWKELVCP